MSSSSTCVEIWLLVLEFCPYMTVRRLWMTGSPLMRQVVSRLKVLEMDNGRFVRRSPSLIYQMLELREIVIRLNYRPDATNPKLNEHLPLASAKLKSLTIDFPHLCVNGSTPNDMPPLKVYFPVLEELSLNAFSRVSDFLTVEFAKNLPQNSLTRLIAPHYRIDDRSVIFLPDSITDMHILLNGSITQDACAREEKTKKKLNHRHSTPLGFPSNLTRLTTFTTGKNRTTYESLPPSITELRLKAKTDETNLPWQLLPRSMASLTVKIDELTRDYLEALPPNLLALDVTIDRPLKIEFLRHLPRTLIYLCLHSSSGSLVYDTSIPINEVLTSLPPRLVGLFFNFLGRRHIPRLKLEIPSETVRKMVSDLLRSPHIIDEAEKSEKTVCVDSDQLRIVYASESSSSDTISLADTEDSLLNTRWIVPERFQNVFYDIPTISIETILNIPKTTTHLRLPSGEIKNHENIRSNDSEWKKALEKIKTGLPRLKTLTISCQSTLLEDVLRGFQSPIENLTISLALLPKNPVFPKTLRTVHFVGLQLYGSQNGSICVNCETLIRSLPRSLTKLCFGLHKMRFFEISSSSIAHLPPSLLEFTACFSVENFDEDDAKNFPRHLRELDITVADSFLPSEKFIRGLPSSLEKLIIHQGGEKYVKYLDQYVQSDELFKCLPEQINEFRIGQASIFVERAHYLAKRAIETSK